MASYIGRLLLFTLLLLLPPPATSNPDSNAEALLLFKESFGNSGALHDWKPGGRPCPGPGQPSWTGVVCVGVTLWGLQLEEMGLTGVVNVGALTLLPDLRSLSVAGNGLAGPIPEVGRLGALKALYLSRNRFSGEIPDQAFAGMGSLKKVHLSDNQFSGVVPASLAAAPKLLELGLENNRFSGELPEFQQHELKEVNVSNNALEGPIPAALAKFNASSFTGNKDLCGKPLHNSCKPRKNTSVIQRALLVIIGIAIFLGIFGAIIAVVSYRGLIFGAINGGNNKTAPSQVNEFEPRSISNHHVVTTQEKLQSRPSYTDNGHSGKLSFVADGREQFELQELLRAHAEVLGSGSLGSSYKAALNSGQMMVVKRFRDMNGVDKEEFKHHMKRMGKMNHPNVLPVLAYYFGKEEKLLVTDFVEKCSLMQALHGNEDSRRSVLDWPTRLKIVKGVARGLTYIHKELAGMNLPHGHLKSSNVLLGKNMDPVLRDYGLSILINPHVAQQIMVAFNSPEFKKYGQVSKKTDVWNLGILILEVLTGKYPANYMGTEKATDGTDLVAWVSAVVREEWTAEVFDKELLGIRRSEGGMYQLLQIGLKCCEKDVDRRWDLREALDRIENVKEKDYYDEDSSFASHDTSQIPAEVIEDEFNFAATVF